MTADQSDAATLPHADSVFGSVSLGYVTIGSEKLTEWKQFLVDGIGLALSEESDEHLAFRMDSHSVRILVEKGPEEDVTALGLHVADAASLSQIRTRLHEKNVAMTYEMGECARRRGVAAFHRFIGPKGLRIELFTAPRTLSDEPVLQSSGYVTAAGGMGHVSLMTREPCRSIAFWQGLFDARVSDTIGLGPGENPSLEVTFLRLNQRHHSIALAATRGTGIDMFRTRIQHLNLEVRHFEDLASAFERCQQLGFKLARHIGQHPNDRELSFYVESPSGFDLEIGWNALTVDEAKWEPGKTYDAMSTWGHAVPGLLGSELRLAHIVNALRSLFRKEFLPW